MPQSKNFLMSATAARQRLSRLGGSVKDGAIVVHAEVEPCWQRKSLVEFDAESYDHAMNIIEAWVKNKKMACGYHYVNPDGSLTGCAGVIDELDLSKKEDEYPDLC